MTDRQENKLSMYQVVGAFFNSNLSDLSAALPAMDAAHLDFKTTLTQLEDFLTQSSNDNQGYAKQKQVLRDICRIKTLALASALRAIFLTEGDEVMAAKVNYTQTDFIRKRDAELYNVCDGVYTIAMANLAKLIPYAYTPERIEEIPVSYTNFKNFIDQPYDERHKSAKATIAANAYFKLVDTKLAIIDSLMAAISPQFEKLYIQYNLNRAIPDTKAKKRKKTFHTFSLPPESITMVLNLHYSPKRRFTITNLSNENLFWNLSTQNDAFSAASYDLSANSKAVEISNQLAKAGDFLLVHNPSGNVVDIEVVVG